MSVLSLLLAGALLLSPTPTPEQFEAKFLHDTNAWRLSHGAAVLAPDVSLMRAARARADDMRMNYLPTSEYLKHIGSDGRPYYDHVAVVSPRAVGINENICRTVAVGEWPANDWRALNAVIDALQNSERHKVNWLHKHYSYVGIGASVGPSGPHKSSLYVTQVFAVGFEDQYSEVFFPKREGVRE